MTPKEKAKELFKKYSKGKDEHGWFLCEFESCAKQCALIAVDEIINSKPSFPYPHEVGKEVNGIFNIIHYPIKYWQEVKQEIENYDA